MARTVAIGIQNYNELIENNYFYIDKTAFLKEWWESGDTYVDYKTAQIWKNAEYEYDGAVFFAGICRKKRFICGKENLGG